MNIAYDDFAKLDLRVGTIKEASAVPDTDKLLVLKVDLGDLGERQIVAGIKKAYDPNTLVGSQIVVLTNLEPRKLRGLESQGMLLAASHDQDLVLVTTKSPIAPGSSVK